jgi:hypothetical protein
MPPLGAVPCRDIKEKSNNITFKAETEISLKFSIQRCSYFFINLAFGVLANYI